MATAEVLHKLRLEIGSYTQIDKTIWKAPQLICGVAEGIVCELLGNARTEWLIELFRLHPEKYIFWCEKEQRISPLAIRQRGVDLNRILFMDSSEDHQKILHRTLESGQYPFIVSPQLSNDVKTLQRLNLLCGKAKSTLFLLPEKEFSQAWPVSLQAEINFLEDEFKVDVIRQKYGGGTS